MFTIEDRFVTSNSQQSLYHPYISGFIHSVKPAKGTFMEVSPAGRFNAIAATEIHAICLCFEFLLL